MRAIIEVPSDLSKDDLENLPNEQKALKFLNGKLKNL